MTFLAEAWTRDRTVGGAVVARAAFAFFMALHVVAWTLVPALVTSNAMLDIIEGLAWGHEWQLGYHKGPPLFAWLVELAADVFGPQLWPIYLESQLCIAVVFFGVWQLARRLCSEIEALLAVVLLEGIYYFTFPTPEFNEIILQMPFAALLGWTLHRALRDDRLVDWTVSGLIAGAGLWARYSMAAYLLPLALFILLHPAARRRLRRPGPYLAAAAAVAVFLPHFLWMSANDFISLHYVQERARSFATADRLALSVINFAGAQALALLPAGLLIAFLARGPAASRPKAREPIEPFDNAYVATLALGPFCTAITLAAASGYGLRTMWGGPLWCFVGLFAVTRLRPALAGERLRRFALIWSLVFALPLAGFAVTNLGGAPLIKRERKAHFPGAMLAQTATGEWYRLTGKPLRYVAGDTWLAGNIGFYSPDRPSVFIDADLSRSPWIDTMALSRAGALLVWSVRREGERIPPQLANAFPEAIDQPTILLRGRRHEIPIGWAVMVPRAAP